jgi:hypothetical protein
MFTEDDLDTILEASGEQIAITLGGVAVSTPWGKFRKNFEPVPGYETSTGILHSIFTMKTSALAGIGNDHVFLIRGIEYKRDGKPVEQPSGFTVVHLGVKK